MSGTQESQRSGSAQNAKVRTGTKRKKLTQKRLKELFRYNAHTGVFSRRVAVGRHGRYVAGSTPGGKTSDGYIRIQVDHFSYKAHRLSFLYVHGFLPEGDIDHIDRNKKNNAISNLREVTRQCNTRNAGNPITNTTGVKGVYWSKRLRKWEVKICVCKKSKHIGLYNSFPNAVCARLAAEQCVGWSGCDNSSPAYRYVKKNINKGAK